MPYSEGILAETLSKSIHANGVMFRNERYTCLGAHLFIVTLALLDQRVVQHDALVLEEPIPESNIRKP